MDDAMRRAAIKLWGLTPPKRSKGEAVIDPESMPGVMLATSREIDDDNLTPIQRRFIAARSMTATDRGASAVSGVADRTHRVWIVQDNDRDEADRHYTAAYERAVQHATDTLVEAARARALTGYLEHTIENGVVTKTRHRYSDALLYRLLAAYKPERFGRHANPTQTRTRHQTFEIRETTIDQGGRDAD